jgi:hypothetical protein
MCSLTIQELKQSRDKEEADEAELLAANALHSSLSHQVFTTSLHY